MGFEHWLCVPTADMPFETLDRIGRVLGVPTPGDWTACAAVHPHPTRSGGDDVGAGGGDAGPSSGGSGGVGDPPSAGGSGGGSAGGSGASAHPPPNSGVVSACGGHDGSEAGSDPDSDDEGAFGPITQVVDVLWHLLMAIPRQFRAQMDPTADPPAAKCLVSAFDCDVAVALMAYLSVTDKHFPVGEWECWHGGVLTRYLHLALRVMDLGGRSPVQMPARYAMFEDGVRHAVNAALGLSSDDALPLRMVGAPRMPSVVPPPLAVSMLGLAVSCATAGAVVEAEGETPRRRVELAGAGAAGDGSDRGGGPVARAARSDVPPTAARALVPAQGAAGACRGVA